MTDKPNPAEEAAKKAAEAQQAYDDAVKDMTDRAAFDHVRAFHPHANTGPDQLKAMVDDYARVKGEREKAAADAQAGEREPPADQRRE